MTDRATVADALAKRGFPPHIVQGIVGNIAVESGFNPGINEITPIVPGSRGGFGLFQHTGPRRRALEAFAAETGRPLADINTQIDFVMQELGTTERRAAEALSRTTTAEEAARVFSETFLRPGIPHLDRRIAEATGQPVTTSTSNGRGILDIVGGQDMAEGERRGLLGGLLDEDRRDRLILALEGMTLNPNTALQQAALSGIQERREQRGAQQQANRTAAFLRSRGREDLAAAVEAGGVDPRAAVQAALTPAAPVRGVEIDGRLVNPVTGEVIADFSEDGPVQSIVSGEQAAALGLDPSKAYNVTQGPDGVKATQIGGGGQTINIGSEVGTIPQGFELITDPDTGARRLQAIPGGPADTTAKEVEQGILTGRAAGVVLDDIRQVEKIVAESALPVTGAIGSFLRNIPGTNAFDTSELITTIRGNIGFDRLQQMRDASPTGGALGQVSERELATLQSVLGSLEQGQSQEQFLRSLKRLEEIYTQILAKASAYPNAAEFGFGPSGVAQPAPTGGATHRFNPETGRVEPIQ